ncbi:MAG: citramalate synthase [Spirochaetes bacterium]|nr:citramalate synthase [Spirochaetota bacterium]
MKGKLISIYDTTLRDGAQTVGISFSIHDKLRITEELDRLKVDFIEGGHPGSNPKDDFFFDEVKKLNLKHSKIAAFGSTKHAKSESYEKDEMLQALTNSKADVVTIVAKASEFQVEKALKIGLRKNLDLIYGTIAFLKDKGCTVFIDGEHFFDGFKANPEYSLETMMKAREAGADMAVLCDTNGGCLPYEIEEIVEKVAKELNIPIGIHCHNDSGVAVANSIAAVMAGAESVQGTINGYGERCGNTDLTTVIPNLALKMGYECRSSEALVHLTEVSRIVSETANLAHNERAPYVGSSSFSTKAGLHVSAIARDTRTYEHVDPESVGNKRMILISELSGKSNIEFKAKELGIDIDNNINFSKDLLKKVKHLEDQGFQFESAEGSFELLIRKATGEYIPFFKLKGFRVITEKKEDAPIICEATIKVEVDGKEEHTASNGDGPIEALDNALRKALEKFYPKISELHLTDYKVRVLDEKAGTAAAVRVIIEQKDKNSHWGTVGVSENIIEASWQALVDGIEYLLYKK